MGLLNLQLPLMKRLSLLLWLFFSLVAFHRASAEPTVISEKRYFFGSPGEREWVDFDGETPDGAALSVSFIGHANATTATLRIRQRDVKLRWTVLLNGKPLSALELNEVLLETAIAVPPGGLREGENMLSIVPQAEGDDIIVDRILLDSRPLEEAIGEATLQLDGRDAESGALLPCRFTIVDKAGALAPLLAVPGQALAVRTGVVYTATGAAEIRLPAGEYAVHLTRGFEYGLATQSIAPKAGEERGVALKIRREVPTPGLAACDTHVHTFTFSHHGDATIDERMITLAGEGVELPVATDHNVYTDYSEAAERMKVTPYFTWLMGCEVTTPKAGHFNAFPIASAQAKLPNVNLPDWPKLMHSIRSVPGVQAIVFNHPRDLHGVRPFTEKTFNAASGDNLVGPDFSFDAIEVANSGTLHSDLSRSWRDWLALLDHGYRTVAVGSSDSHDVSRFIVGQGRTYVACDDHDPGKIDRAEAVRNFLAGHAYVSLGLLTTLTVDDKFSAGDTATGLGSELHVKVRVLGPAWSRAEKVALYMNSVRVREEPIAKPDAAGEKEVFAWTIPKPAHDCYLVAIVTGPGIREPYWNLPFPYQPVGRVREPGSFGLSNPVWIDADGDGQYTSPRAQAVAVLKAFGTSTEKLFPALAEFDEAVATQAASLCEAQLVEIRGAAFQEALVTAPDYVGRGFAHFLAPPP